MGWMFAWASLRYFESFKTIGMELAQKHLEQMQDEGKTSVARRAARKRRGASHRHHRHRRRVAKRIQECIADLKSLGVEKVIMLTGDRDRVAQAIAKQAGVDEYYAGLLPEDKLQILKKAWNNNTGAWRWSATEVNDAPALAAASVGIAMGAAGTDVALETADVVLMSDDLTNIPYVIALSRKTQKDSLRQSCFLYRHDGLTHHHHNFYYAPLASRRHRARRQHGVGVVEWIEVVGV